MNHSLFIPIDKLMFWRSGSWAKHDNKLFNLTLRIHHDQLLISTDEKVVESFNMNGKIKGIYKDDKVILIVSNVVQEIRKLKFQIKSNLSECLHILGQHFPVMSHSSVQSKNVISTRYRNVDEVFKSAIETMEGNGNEPLPLPPSYNNFVKLCLLDPSFPQIVLETQKILDNEVLKK